MSPWLKPTHVGGLRLSTLASVALGQFLDHPTVLGMLFWSLVCPPGCGLLLSSYVPHSPAPPLMGIDIGLIPYERCMEKEGHLQCRNSTTSRALDIIALCKVGVDVHLTRHGPILHAEIYMQHKQCNTVVKPITDIYGTFATGQALCSVLHVDLKHLVLTTTL